MTDRLMDRQRQVLALASNDLINRQISEWVLSGSNGARLSSHDW